MENLTKQQLVLLTLLVSVITSVATSVVIISLDGQSASSVTNTIERVIDDGVAETVPGNSTATAAVSTAVAPTDSLAAAVAGAKKSIAFIHGSNAPGAVSGLGLVVNTRGTVMTDKAALTGLADYAITYPNGREYPAAIVESQVGGDIVFLDPIGASNADFTPAAIGPSPSIGQVAASLGDTDAGALHLGLVDEILAADAATGLPAAISTTIASGDLLPGSPLIDASGGFLGLRTSALAAATSTEFYPISLIADGIPK